MLLEPNGQAITLFNVTISIELMKGNPEKKSSSSTEPTNVWRKELVAWAHLGTKTLSFRCWSLGFCSLADSLRPQKSINHVCDKGFQHTMFSSPGEVCSSLLPLHLTGETNTFNSCGAPLLEMGCLTFWFAMLSVFLMVCAMVGCWLLLLLLL